MKLLLLFFSFFTLLFSNQTVKISSDKSEITNFKLSYLIDTNGTLEFEDVAQMAFKKAQNRDSLGTDIKTSWVKIELLNTTSKEQTLILHQDTAYRVASLEYFETDANAKLITSKKITPYGSFARDELHGADALFEFKLAPKQSKTLYIRQQTLAFHYYNFYLFSPKESLEYLITQKVDAILIIGLLLALILYNFFLFLFSKRQEYLYYSLYLFSSTVWLAYSYGALAHYFYIYGEVPIRFNFGIMLAPLFLSLFLQAIFKTQEHYKFENKLLLSVMLFSLVNFFYALFDFSNALLLMSFSLSYALFIFLWFSLSLCKKGNRLAKIFLIAHSIYLFFSTYSLLYFQGFVDANYFSIHGTSIGLIIEALLLSYLVYYKFKMIEKNNEEKRLKHIELKFLASTDPLTKLYNRRYFSEISEKILQLAKRENHSVSIMMIDIDKFKNVNDTYGHQFGDEVLIFLSQKLTQHQRKSDVICRYGGEEFVILLPQTSLADAQKIAEEIRKLIESLTMSPPENKNFKFTISIGVSQVNVLDESSIDPALKRSDDAMYEAKRTGRNRVVSKDF